MDGGKTLHNSFKITKAGDSALLVQFRDEISPEINTEVRCLDYALNKMNIKGIVETVPAYCSLLIIFDPLALDVELLKRNITDIAKNFKLSALPQPTVITIPVCYGDSFGPDLDFVCQYTHLAKEEVIALHSERNYLIYMLGFLPGFPYLGGIDKRLAVPRLDTPRISVRSGSVGIANNQTGIYPVESPGGWRIIGRTPLNIYDPLRNPPVLFDAGNYLRFKPITHQEYETISKQVEKGTYKVKTEEMKEGPI